MLVDVSVDLVGITAQMHYWSAMISDICHKCPQPSSIILVGTHVDKVKKDYLLAIGKEIKRITKDIFKPHIFEEFIGLNVIKRHGKGLKNFLSFLDQINKHVEKRSPAISLTSHVMYAFLNDKIPSNKDVISMSSLMSLLEGEKLQVLPTKASEIIPLLDTLAEKGFIVFLHTENDDSWIVLDQGALLGKVNGALFAPSFFKQYLPIASNTGIIPMDILGRHFPDYNTAMIVQFLIKLQLCQCISIDNISTNMIPQNPTSSDLLFFPPLIMEDRPPFGLNEIANPERCFGWLLSTDNVHFFPNRFLHTLILKVAYELCLPNRKPIIDINNKNLQCMVWRCGIFWNNLNGVSTFIELMEQSRCLFLVMSFPDPKYCNELIPVLKLIKDTFYNFSASIPATEYIVDPNKASSVFTQGCSPLSLTSVRLSHLHDALKEGHPVVVDINNKVVHTDKWTRLEPCLPDLVSIAMHGKVAIVSICGVICLPLTGIHNIPRRQQLLIG